MKKIFNISKKRQLITNYFRFLFSTREELQSKQGSLYIFAGQGTQQKRMLDKLLLDKNQKNSQFYNQMINRASQEVNIDFKQITNKDQNNFINITSYTQPLLVLSHYLHFHKYFNQKQINLDLQRGYRSSNDYLIGHSLGQYSALAISGSISLFDCLKLVKKRGQLMMKYTTSPHGMLIIKYKKQQQNKIYDKIKELNLQIACFNSPTSIIVAGQQDKLQKLKQNLKGIRIGSMFLPVSTAFHCKMLRKMEGQFKQELNKFNFKRPQCKIVRNLDMKIYTPSDKDKQNENIDEDIKQGLLKQLYNPVRFSQSVQIVKNTKQVDSFEQIGHKKWISKFVQEIWTSSK